MSFTFFTDENNNPFLPIGLQAHNSSTGTDMIKKAIEAIYGVNVAKVNTISMKGTKRRTGRYEGYTSDWKKAVVTLTEDSKTIADFDGLF